MNEQPYLPTQGKAAQAFNESVNNAVLLNFELNNDLIAKGVSPTAVSLANALAAADLIAAMAVEANSSIDAVNVLLERLLDDMKCRAVAAHEYYTQRKAEASAANDEATGA